METEKSTKVLQKFGTALLLLLLSLFVFTTAKNFGKVQETKNVVCQDNNGLEVPWWVVYKLPIDNTSSDPLLLNATKYSYILPGQSELQIAEEGIDSPDGPLGRTFSPIFTNPDEVGYIFFNDMPGNYTIPGTIWGKYGHTKGLVITGTHSSVWMIVSSPQFPQMIDPGENLTTFLNRSFANGKTDSKDRPDMARNDYVNAQITLCVTVPTPYIKNIGDYLLQTHGFIYQYKLTPSIPNLLYFPWYTILAIQGINLTNYPDPHKNASIKIHSLTTTSPSIDGVEGKDYDLRIFVKKPTCVIEIFSDCIAPVLKTNLLVQAWTLHNGYLPSVCDRKYETVNLITKVVDGYPIGRKDHAKWAIGVDKDAPWFCVSDLNRRYEHRHAGGFTICIADENLRNAFRQIVNETEPCP